MSEITISTGHPDAGRQDICAALKPSEGGGDD